VVWKGLLSTQVYAEHDLFFSQRAENPPVILFSNCMLAGQLQEKVSNEYHCKGLPLFLLLTFPTEDLLCNPSLLPYGTQAT
jgi:hypothetical protein